MLDIIQSYDSIKNPQRVIFSGDSPSGNTWMQQQFGSIIKSFPLADPTEAKDFKVRALAAGLKVDPNW